MAPELTEAPEVCAASSTYTPRLVRLGAEELRRHLAESLPGVDPDRLARVRLRGEHTAPTSERVVSSADFGAFYRAARAVAEDFVANSAETQACRDAQDTECQTRLQASVERLYRRPATQEEWGALLGVYQRLMPAQGHTAAAAAVVAGALISPQVLHLTELGTGPVAAGQAHTLDAQQALELARFAFTGRGSTAEERQLLATTAAPDRASQLGLLAADWVQSPEFDERLRDFSEHWLSVQRLEEIERLDPDFTPELRSALREEFRSFVAQTLLGPQGSFAELFTTSPSPSPELEAIYAPEGATPQELSAGQTARRGLLGLPALLTTKAGAESSDPVKRGLLVRITLLCEAMPPPIPNADFSLVMTTEDMQTRERFEALASLPACQSCHEIINSPGYLFEHFDQLGRYRATEKGRPIDASGTLPAFFGQDPYPGVEAWDGLVPLSEWLSTSEQVRSCFAARFASYVLADDIPDGMSNCELPQIAERFVQSGQLGELAEDIIRSDLFWNRVRGEQ